MADEVSETSGMLLVTMARRTLSGAVLSAFTTFLLLLAFSSVKGDFDWDSILAMTAFAMNIGAAAGAVQGRRGPRASFWLCSFYVVFGTFVLVAIAFAFFRVEMQVAAPLFGTPREIVLVLAPWLAAMFSGLLVPRSWLEAAVPEPPKPRRVLTPYWERSGPV